MFAVACEMVRAGCEDQVIASVLLDKDFGISAHLYRQSNPHDYAARQIRRAKEATATEQRPKTNSDDPAAVLLEMNERHAVIENYGNRTLVMTEGPPAFFQSFDDFRNTYMNRQVHAGTDDEGKAIRVPRGKWWLGQEDRRQYRRVEFLPGGKPVDATSILLLAAAVALITFAFVMREKPVDDAGAGPSQAEKVTVNSSVGEVQARTPATDTIPRSPAEIALLNVSRFKVAMLPYWQIYEEASLAMTCNLRSVQWFETIMTAHQLALIKLRDKYKVSDDVVEAAGKHANAVVGSAKLPDACVRLSNSPTMYKLDIYEQRLTGGYH